MYSKELKKTRFLPPNKAYSFRVGKLVPALARVNESMPQIEPCHGATMCVVKIDVTLIVWFVFLILESSEGRFSCSLFFIKVILCFMC